MEMVLALFSIIAVNLLLSGDNALVIALASRRLPEREQKLALLWGSGGAVVLRVLLTLLAVSLLRLPYLHLIGGLLLLWIAIKLVVKEDDNHEQVEAARGLMAAIRTIIIADLVMSLDNIVAIVGVSRGNTLLLVFGLTISIPIIIWGSRLIGMIINRWPLIIVIGAAFLGWTAGEMVLDDPKTLQFLANTGWTWLEWAIPVSFAAAALAVGVFFSQQQAAPEKQN